MYISLLVKKQETSPTRVFFSHIQASVAARAEVKSNAFSLNFRGYIFTK